MYLSSTDMSVVAVKQRLCSLLFLVLVLCHSQYSHSALEVTYPNVNGEGADSYGYAVLQLALDHSGEAYQLNLKQTQVNNERIRSMILSDKVSIADFGTSKRFEEMFLPIYFPIDMGISGWRIFAIRKHQQRKLSKVQNILSLRDYTVGQGVGWSDVDILRRAGFSVTSSPAIESLFRMLSAGRFDLLPLGANEIHSLLNSNAKSTKNLVVESDIVLVYPFARMFFVNKHNVRLRDAVLRGLKASFETGSFWQLYRSHPHNAPLFTDVGLAKRRIIRISNPLFESTMSQISSKYFFSLEMLQ